MEKAAQAVEQATSLANQSGEALKQIVVLSEDNSDQVRSIATAAEQQSATSEEINRAVEDVSRIATETVDGMAQANAAVARLAELVRDLENLIDKLEAAGKGDNMPWRTTTATPAWLSGPPALKCRNAPSLSA